MKAKQLIKRLQRLDPNAEVFLENRMGCPAYDYEGQVFRIGTGRKANMLSIASEVDDQGRRMKPICVNTIKTTPLDLLKCLFGKHVWDNEDQHPLAIYCLHCDTEFCSWS